MLMNKIMLKIALLAFLFAMPMALAQQGGGGSPGNVQELMQLVEGFDQEAAAAAVASGLITVQVIAQNVNVQALNNVNVNVQLTDVLNDLGILTDSQVVVNVLTFGDQFVVRVIDTVE
jgi:hypothetical protein